MWIICDATGGCRDLPQVTERRIPGRRNRQCVPRPRQFGPIRNKCQRERRRTHDCPRSESPECHSELTPRNVKRLAGWSRVWPDLTHGTKALEWPPLESRWLLPRNIAFRGATLAKTIIRLAESAFADQTRPAALATEVRRGPVLLDRMSSVSRRSLIPSPPDALKTTRPRCRRRRGRSRSRWGAGGGRAWSACHRRWRRRSRRRPRPAPRAQASASRSAPRAGSGPS
jgi:hypothetical protein